MVCACVESFDHSEICSHKSYHRRRYKTTAYGTFIPQRSLKELDNEIHFIIPCICDNFRYRKFPCFIARGFMVLTIKFSLPTVYLNMVYVSAGEPI